MAVSCFYFDLSPAVLSEAGGALLDKEQISETLSDPGSEDQTPMRGVAQRVSEGMDLQLIPSSWR